MLRAEVEWVFVHLICQCFIVTWDDIKEPKLTDISGYVRMSFSADHVQVVEPNPFLVGSTNQL